MTIRDSTIAKLQQLPEPLLQEVSDFIDFISQKHLAKTAESQSNDIMSDRSAIISLIQNPVETLYITSLHYG